MVQTTMAKYTLDARRFTLTHPTWTITRLESLPLNGHLRHCVFRIIYTPSTPCHTKIQTRVPWGFSLEVWSWVQVNKFRVALLKVCHGVSTNTFIASWIRSKIRYKTHCVTSDPLCQVWWSRHKQFENTWISLYEVDFSSLASVPESHCRPLLWWDNLTYRRVVYGLWT